MTVATQTLAIDPRGIFRRVVAVEVRSDVVLVSYDGCGHIGRMNPSRPGAHRVGDETRCYQCGVEARASETSK